MKTNASPEPPEIVLSAAWHEGTIPSSLETTGGVPIEVVHRGIWSHGLGPDFNDALILFDGRELRAGSVEVHLRTQGWSDHGHHLDPAYDSVILHLVGRHDGSEARRSDGFIVPAAEIGPIERFPWPAFAEWDWHRVGGACCAAQLASEAPEVLRQTLFRLGDIRLAGRSARIESRLPSEPPGEILWAEILDGLGYTANREPMRALARVVSLVAIEDIVRAVARDERIHTARGILLGAAGFLPLSPSEAHAGRLGGDDVAALEWAWHERGSPWRQESLPPISWRQARVRPANHPVARLSAAASMVATACAGSGLLAHLLETVTADLGPVAGLRHLAMSHDGPGIGEDRALDIAASTVIPFALAIASHTGDAALSECASERWERLPAPAMNSVAKRAARQVAGSASLRKIGARGAQGLLHLDTTLCQPRRCFECPIAAAELCVKA